MAAFPANLSEEARGVLRIILDSKIVRGADLMRRREIKDANQLLEPIKELLNQRLIEVTGELTPGAFPFATFGTPPSAQEYIRALLQQR
jgi:hypothetical protein